MGVLRKNKITNNSSLDYSKSKGNRLGWVSVNQVKEVKLETALSSRRVVKKTNKFTPLLVP